ncbi:MAG TPA: alanine--tRNA ligase-related protein [Candidatus Dojkabacteria bacterium]|nr:alanine--tRNA ligase-related protein [Candidatus Dojkabacteria bacterium]
MHKSEIQSENLALLKSQYSNEGILAVRESFEDSFRKFFEECNYTEVAPLPLLSDQDNSVIYTGASISALKDILLSQNYPDGTNGVFVSQECLRTGAKDRMLERDWVPFGQIYFQMISNLSIPYRFKDVFKEAIDFTQKVVGIEKERIKILSSKNLGQIDDLEQLTDLEVEYDTRDQSFYNWKYGIDGVKGEGLTIAVYNPSIDNWMEVGNIVIIYDESGKELGIEFGYGYEYFLTAALGLDNPLKLSKVFEVFDFEPGLLLKYYYNLEAIANMKIAGSHVGEYGAEYVYRKYLKYLLHNGGLVGKNSDEILHDLSKYGESFHNTDIDLSEEREFFKKHQMRKDNFRSLVNRVWDHLNDLRNNVKPKERKLNPVKVIKHFLSKNGLNIEEVTDSLEVLREFDILDKLN